MKTKDPNNNYFWAALICWIIAGFTVALWFYLATERWEYQTVSPPLFPMTTLDELRDTHKYHGIIFSEQNKNGQWGFKRDGQKCRLFAHKKGD